MKDNSIGGKIKNIFMIFILAFFAFPLVFTICNSFMSSSEINMSYGMLNGGTVDENKCIIGDYGSIRLIPQQVTLSQYSELLLKDSDYLMYYVNSLIYTIPIVIVQLGISLLGAYAICLLKRKLSDALIILYMVVCMLPYQVTLVPNFLVLNKMNLIDTMWSIWLPGFTGPFSVYLFSRYMKRIPVDLIEAARIDGAGEWNIFIKIILPLCRNSIVSVAILVFIDYWNMIEQPLLFLFDNTKHPLSVFISQYNETNIAMAFAASVVYMILPLLIFLYGRDYLIDGVSCMNGIKG